MSNDEIKIEGMEELLKAMKELPINISKNALRGAVFLGAKELAEQLKVKAPVRTGELRDSIKAVRGRIDEQGVAKANVHGAFWGRFYEHGTSHQPARPWIRPVMDQQQSNILRIVGEGLAKTFEKVVGRAAKKVRKSG